MHQKQRFESASTDDSRYRMLIEAVTDYAIYMLDPQGLISSWNAGARRFKGYEESEIVGENFSRLAVHLGPCPRHRRLGPPANLGPA